MAVWVLEASGGAAVRLRDGPQHRVQAAYWVQAFTGYGPVVRQTFLVEAGAAAGAILEALIPAGRATWDIAARRAPDGTYPDSESRSAVVVRDGAVVAVHGG